MVNHFPSRYLRMELAKDDVNTYHNHTGGSPMRGHTLRRMFYSAGRIFDFSGTYNSCMLRERFSLPGWMRDRQNLMRDGRVLQNDLTRAAWRLEHYFGKNN